MFCGCSSDDDKTLPHEDEPVQDVFYVKYEVKMYVPSRFKMNLIFTTDHGRQSLSTPSSTWEATYGPFKKGDAVSITASTQKSSVLSANYARIYVSKNNSPFGIKAEENADYNNDLNVGYKMQ